MGVTYTRPYLNSAEHPQAFGPSKQAHPLWSPTQHIHLQFVKCGKKYYKGYQNVKNSHDNNNDGDYEQAFQSFLMATF